MKIRTISIFIIMAIVLSSICFFTGCSKKYTWDCGEYGIFTEGKYKDKTIAKTDTDLQPTSFTGIKANDGYKFKGWKLTNKNYYTAQYTKSLGFTIDYPHEIIDGIITVQFERDKAQLPLGIFQNIQDLSTGDITRKEAIIRDCDENEYVFIGKADCVICPNEYRAIYFETTLNFTVPDNFYEVGSYQFTINIILDKR